MGSVTMQQDILINWSPQETRVAVVEHGAVQELHVERTLERGLVGNVYLGKVSRVLPGMQSAFIDIGLERVHNMRSYAGELLNRADRITGNQETRSIQLEADRSRAEDLDMIKGISDFQNQQVGYEAALKSYSMVQKLSLFNFIS